MIQLLIPFSHFLLMMSRQLFVLQDLYFPPSPRLWSLHACQEMSRHCLPPCPAPGARHPWTRVRDESQEISWSLPKVSDGNEGTLQTIAGNGYHYLCKFLTTTTVTWGTPDILLHVAANYQRPAVQILTAAVACARISPGLCSFHPLSLPDLVCNSGYITSKNLTFLCHPAATHQSKGNGFTLKWKKNQFRDLNAQRK